jgi:DNA-binding CsgD family transcriptional regulator
MAKCPHCGGSLLSARQQLPKKLTKTHQKVLSFCRQERTSKEIAEFLGTTMSGIYHHLRLLQRLDQLEKIQDPRAGGHNWGCKFKATGKQIAFDPAWMRYTTSVMGVRL